MSGFWKNCQSSTSATAAAAAAAARAIREFARVCGARRDAISSRARVRRVKVEYLSLLLGLLVFTSRHCDNEELWSLSLSVRRGGRRQGRPD